MIKNRHRTVVGDDAVYWAGMIAGFVAILFVDHLSMPQKWHAAIMWTFCALGLATVMGRRWWMSRLFWSLWTILLCLHLLVMWGLFEHLFTAVRVVGMMSVIPFGFIEGFILVVVFARINRRFQMGRA